MKLTKKQVNKLLSILTGLEAARDELANDRTQIFLVSDLQGSKIPGGGIQNFTTTRRQKVLYRNSLEVTWHYFQQPFTSLKSL